MREGIMSIGLVGSSKPASEMERDEIRPEVRILREPRGWNPENFARQQIQGLVRQVFFSNGARPVRQVVLSAVEPQTEVRRLCRRVGEALARETAGSVAVLSGCGAFSGSQQMAGVTAGDGIMPLRRIATRVRSNLWLVPGAGSDPDAGTASLHSYLGELRREFEYSIVEGPSAGESSEATAMAQFAGGVILVLSALHTRRVTARKVKEAMEAAQARILGTVLSDRVFPIPEGIYRRL